MLPAMGNYFSDGVARYREAQSRELGCDPAIFDSHALSITEKPSTTAASWKLMALTSGTGTAVSVVPEYIDWVRENAPEMHYRAMFANVIAQPFAAEAARRGEVFGWRTPNLIFMAEERPVPAVPPDGFRAVRVDREWRAQLLPSGDYDNALGEPNDTYVDTLWRWGVALYQEDQLAAVAGAYDDGGGLLEIGVDVTRSFRGQRLGEAVVRLMAAAIADEGSMPTYYCGPTNVRSHRTALACGFLPMASGARVSALA